MREGDREGERERESGLTKHNEQKWLHNLRMNSSLCIYINSGYEWGI